MIAVITYEVVARYFFNAPTPWAQDTSGWLQVAYVFLGGAWTLRRGYMVRVDILYGSFSPRLQAIIDLSVSTLLFAAFTVVMVWKGWNMAMQSFGMGEVSSTGSWRGPVWPAKFLVPIGMGLLTIAWLTQICRQALGLIRPGRA
jgi:TRAP-type mannitol/chloroaromatic compound transport system permease small subunit